LILLLENILDSRRLLLQSSRIAAKQEGVDVFGKVLERYQRTSAKVDNAGAMFLPLEMRFLAFPVLLLATSPLFAEPGLSSPSFGIAAGQVARITVLNLGTRQSSAGTSCQVTAQFLDPKAAVIKEQTIEVGAGKNVSVDLDRDAYSLNKRVQLRAVLVFGHVGGAAPGPDAQKTMDCNIVPTLEIYDRANLRTSVILTDWKQSPIADPRSIAFSPRR
jgi:hypothetical protein